MPELTPEIKLFRDLFLVATESAQPRFELAARMYALYRGHKPWQARRVILLSLFFLW